MRVAVLTDLHVGSPYKGLDSLRRLVRRTNELSPDLILLPGDFVIQGILGGSYVHPNDLAPVLAELRAPFGVFAVMGNHDWWLRRPRELIKAFGENDIPLLLDEAVRIDAGGAPFWVAGIGDFWETEHDIDSALAMVSDDAPVVAFTHNPDIFPDMPARVNLTVCRSYSRRPGVRAARGSPRGAIGVWRALRDRSNQRSGSGDVRLERGRDQYLARAVSGSAGDHDAGAGSGTRGLSRAPSAPTGRSAGIDPPDRGTRSLACRRFEPSLARAAASAPLLRARAGARVAAASRP